MTDRQGGDPITNGDVPMVEPNSIETGQLRQVNRADIMKYLFVIFSELDNSEPNDTQINLALADLVAMMGRRGQLGVDTTLRNDTHEYDITVSIWRSARDK